MRGQETTGARTDLRRACTSPSRRTSDGRRRPSRGCAGRGPSVVIANLTCWCHDGHASGMTSPRPELDPVDGLLDDALQPALVDRVVELGIPEAELFTADRRPRLAALVALGEPEVIAER